MRSRCTGGVWMSQGQTLVRCDAALTGDWQTKKTGGKGAKKTDRTLTEP